MSKGPLELVLISSLTPWDGVNMNGPGRTSTKVLQMGWGPVEHQPHGPPVIGCEDGLLVGPC